MIRSSSDIVVSAARMPSKKIKFAILDSSVYIENFRTGRFAAEIFQPTYVHRCSSVVLHELLRGARSQNEKHFVFDLQERSHVVTPSARHWMDAAELLHAIRKREHYDVSKLRELAFDVLIALSARSIGATLITCNKIDFQAIRRYLPFHLVCWE